MSAMIRSTRPRRILKEALHNGHVGMFVGARLGASTSRLSRDASSSMTLR